MIELRDKSIYFYETTFRIILKKKIHMKDLHAQLNDGINLTFLDNPKLTEFHEQNGFKYYVYSELLPQEKDNWYKKGKTYQLIFRSCKNNLSEIIDTFITRNNPIFYVDGKPTMIKRYSLHNFKNISKIKTLTPSILTMQNHKYMDVSTFDKIKTKQSLENHLKHKLNVLYPEIEIKDEMVKEITLMQPHSYVSNYKGGFLIGNKYKVEFHENESGKLGIFISLGCGLFEKNTLGFGFSNPIN